MNSEQNQYETPFADAFLTREEPVGNESAEYRISAFLKASESPFMKTYELQETGSSKSPFAEEIAEFLGELNDHEFSNNLYELASDLDDSWLPKISNEAAMGNNFIPFVTQQAEEYFRPLIKAGEGMIDRISKRFSENNMAGRSEGEIEAYFNDFEIETNGLSPAQEQFLGSVFKKVKSAVSKGISLAGKLLPVNVILGKLKGLIRPLLDRVLKFAIGKLPKNLQPYAQTLSKKLLNMETPYEPVSGESSLSTSGEMDAIQTELNNEIAHLVYAPDETEAENFVIQYESSATDIDRPYETGELNGSSLDVARQQFINELANLQSGENPAPAIERFIPAVMALKPLIKMGISVIGRPKVINFLAGLLSQLVSKYVPQNVAKPLASSIIDAGMSAIGFETYEMSKPDVAYEALVNTIQDTIQGMAEMNEANPDDQESLTLNLMEAFETAAANNFPSQYIREDLRNTKEPGVWVLKPRNGPRHSYKKYTRVYPVTIDPQSAKTITTFRDLPLSSFLRDKLGLDPSKPIQAQVHLFESIPGTKLSRISKHENLPGFAPSQPYSWIQLHPLSSRAASLLINEPAMGKDFPKKFTSKRFHIAVGQRFYYLEINGARLRINTVVRPNQLQSGSQSGTNKPAHSDDIHGVINFVKSSISISYYFSEEEAKTVVEKLNQNDFLGAANAIKHSVKEVMRSMLLGNLTNKVKIIHESFPEMYLENYEDPQENQLSLSPGKSILTMLIDNMVNKVAGIAYQEIRDYFKSRAAEFKNAQAEPQDGVTIKLLWNNIPGMASIKSIISAIREKHLLNPANLSFPNLTRPDIQIKAGKHLD
jgi:hypothetical protein